MEIIREGDAICNLVLPTKSFETGKSYRLIHYAFVVKVDNGYLLFNNLTKELILLSKQEYSEITEEEIKESELVNTLIAKFFLISDKTDEKTLSEQLCDVARSMDRTSGLDGYLVFTTTACNARCFYCFEAGTPVFTMDDKTAHDLAEFMVKHKAGKFLHIRWFGGEPLCNTRAIDIICSYLMKNNVEFVSDMVTNGYLFDRELAKHAKEAWNQKFVQITLDGNAETYNKVKNYKNGDKNAFDRVCRNIDSLLEVGIYVDIRLNLDNHNEEELFSLVDFLESKYKDYFTANKIAVHSHLIFEDTGYVKTVHNDTERHNLFLKYKELEEYILAKNMAPKHKLSKRIKTRFCEADSLNSILVSPQGKLGRCEHHANDDFFATIYDYTENKPLRDYCMPTKDCEKCNVYPSCMRIKGCNGYNDECYEYERYNMQQKIIQAMLETYKKYQENN